MMLIRLMAPAATIAFIILSSIGVPREPFASFRNDDARLVTIPAYQDFDHVRDAAVLETLETIDTLLVDKTGTLTEGKPNLVDIAAEDSQDENELLKLAAAVESQSEHPLARAITRGAKERDLDLPDVNDFQSTTGGGVTGTVDGKTVRVGTEDFLKSQDVAIPDALKNLAQDWREQGRTAMFMSVDDRAAGLLAVAMSRSSKFPKTLGRITCSSKSVV